MPLVAIITPASVPAIPSAVNSRYPMPALPTVPAGITCATAAAARSIRNSRDSRGWPPAAAAPGSAARSRTATRPRARGRRSSSRYSGGRAGSRSLRAPTSSGMTRYSMTRSRTKMTRPRRSGAGILDFRPRRAGPPGRPGIWSERITVPSPSGRQHAGRGLAPGQAPPANAAWRRPMSAPRSLAGGLRPAPAHRSALPGLPAGVGTVDHEDPSAPTDHHRARLVLQRSHRVTCLHGCLLLA